MDGKSQTLPGRQRAVQSLLSKRVVISLVLLGLNLILLAPLIASVHVAEYDEAIFLDVARNIQRLGLPLRSMGANGSFFFDHTPLYVYLLSLYARHNAAGLLLARLVTVVAALAAVALTYRFGARIADVRTGALAALLLAVNPFFLVHAFFVRMELFMLLCVLAGFYALVVGMETRHWGQLGVAGLGLAIGVLFKEFALIGVGVAVVYTLWRWDGSVWRRVGAALAVGGPSVAGLACWLVWTWKLSPATFAATMNRWIGSAVGQAAVDPRAGTGWPAWGAQLASLLLGPGLALGLLLFVAQWVLRRGPMSRANGLLWPYVLVSIGLSFFISLKEPRHLIGILPAAALLSSQALVRGLDGAGGWRRAAALAAIMVVLCFAGPVRPPLLPRQLPAEAPPWHSWLAQVYADRLASDGFYQVLADAGGRVQALIGPDEVVTIVHQAPVVAYYADRPYRMLYTQPVERVAALLREANVLVWDASMFVYLNDKERAAVSDSVATEFRLVEQVSAGQRTVAIYQRK